MTVLIWVLVGIIAVVLLFLILRSYRRQADLREPRGKVPEDY